MPPISKNKIKKLIQNNFSTFFPYNYDEIQYSFRILDKNKILLVGLENKLIVPEIEKFKNLWIKNVNTYENFLSIKFENFLKENYIVCYENENYLWCLTYENGILSNFILFDNEISVNHRLELDKIFLSYKTQGFYSKVILQKDNVWLIEYFLDLKIQIIYKDLI